MSEYKTLWYVSIISNCVALGLSAMVGYLYSGYKYNKQDKDDKSYHMKWYDYFAAFWFAVITAFVVYGVVLGLFGYVPMGKILPGLHERINDRLS
tara:strand:+ start:5813 stop:6097 length:285 start_codon:yes stop_codon:yes gene_type:complete